MANRTRAKRSRANRKRVNRTKAYRSRVNRTKANRSRVNRTKANRSRANRRKKNTKAKRRKYGGRPLHGDDEDEPPAREKGDEIVYLRERYANMKFSDLGGLLEELRARKILSTGTMKNDDWRKSCLTWHVSPRAPEVVPGDEVEADFPGRVKPEISKKNDGVFKDTWYKVRWTAEEPGGGYTYSVYKRFSEFEHLEEKLKNITEAAGLDWPVMDLPNRNRWGLRVKVFGRTSHGHRIQELNRWLDEVDEHLDKRRKELAGNPDVTKITAIKNLNKFFAVFLILDDQDIGDKGAKVLRKQSEYHEIFLYDLVSALLKEVFGLELKVQGLLDRGLFTMGDEAAEELLQHAGGDVGKAKALLDAVSARKEFPKGTKVTWVDKEEDIPEGTVGTVVDPAPRGQPGWVTVDFQGVDGNFLATHLQRAPAPGGAE